MSPSHSSNAIILRARPYGESDKIVTFLTDDAGKLTGIAKGAKNSRRRFANCLDPLTLVRVHFRTRAGAGLVFMDSCDLMDPPGSLSDPIKFAYASYLVELVDQLTEEAHPVGEVYALLAEGLGALRAGAATAGFLRGFELRLLGHTGYEPQLTGCSKCQRSVLAAERAFLDPVRGLILCEQCRATAHALLPVAGQTLTALQSMKDSALDDVRKRRFAHPVAAEAAQVMGRLLALHLPRPLRSVKLIAALSS